MKLNHCEKHNRPRIECGFCVGEVLSIETGDKLCADCGCPIGIQKNEPPSGWQLEDGRTVCQACWVYNIRLFCELLVNTSGNK